MRKKFLLKYLGISLGITTLVANIQYALLDYGMHDNSLGYQLIAQTGGTGGSNTGGGNTGGGDTGGGNTGGNTNGGGSNGNTLWHRNDKNCVYSFTGKAGAVITIFGGKVLTIGADGTASYTVTDGQTVCTAGGQQQCTSRYCDPL